MSTRCSVFTYTSMPGFAVVILAAIALTLPVVADGPVQWRNPVADVSQAQSPGELLSQVSRAQSDGHVIVRLADIPGASQRAELRANGLTLLRYLGGNAYFAAVDGKARVDRLVGVGGVVHAEKIRREHKLAPVIIDGNYPAYARGTHPDTEVTTVAAYVIFHADVSLADGLARVSELGGETIGLITSLNGAVIELPEAALEALAAEDAVQWIEPPLPEFSTTNESNRARVQADDVQAAPYSLDGTGVTVLVYDGGRARATHVDFGGRLTTHDSSSTSYHATHVAGTVGGDGSASGGLHAGMAPNVEMLSYGFQYDYSGIFLYSNPGDLESDYNQAINTYGADISNNSIGTNTESNGFPCSIQGDYGVTSALIDAIVGGSLGEPFRIVWAAGNERQGSRCDIEGYGDYYSTAPPAGAKNHITVGALNSNNDSMTSFSSWGPTDDGRLKPDISGPGCQSNDDYGVTSCYSSSDTAYAALCGTSMAAPTVTGSLALLLQDFRDYFPGNPDPRNSTLKILLAHNAVDLGNTGPDYLYGYGSIRIRDTIDFMRTGNFAEDQVVQGGSVNYQISVPAGTPELKVTLAWDDAPGTPNVNPALVNNLDLVVLSPSGQRAWPWTLNPGNPGAGAVRTRADDVNNIEQVYVSNPASGTWTIQVTGTSVPVGPQAFSICASPELGTGGLVDCNNNGIPDDQDIADCDGSTWCSDCNNNGIPDGCDIDSGAEDCNNNGVPDECETDSDSDGVIDACDGCPNDPNKTDPGVCGCGTPDTDSDNDGTPDCNDGCPFDPNKIAPGVCGCGSPDIDSDNDGVLDCNDGCPFDPDKIEPGICGCGNPDIDSDNDGVLDCNDGCPNDPNKTDPGICGCGNPDNDSDGDGFLDCEDNCPATYNPDQADCDGDGVGDACSSGPDCNANGIPDDCDIALGTSADCNTNGVPDECDISDGTSLDENGNGIPDECEQAQIVDVVSNGEANVAGRVTGTYQDTWSDNGVAEIITERESGGKPSNRYSYLYHKWTFDVPAGGVVTLHLNAYRDVSTDGDDFIFAYSTDDVDYIDMFTLFNTSDDGSYIMYELPPTVQGTCYVRVVDTDQTSGNRPVDSVYVDHLFVRVATSSGGQPPAAPSNLDATAASTSSVDLSWSDNSSDEAGFEIERSLDGAQWELIDTVAENTVAYVDGGLIPGTTYFYRVRAYNAAGHSAYTNVASATTPTGGGIVLEAVGHSLGKNQVADLTWSGATTANVEIYRNGEWIATTANSGSYRDRVGKEITGTFTYQVCEEGTTACSNEATVSF